MRLSDITVSRVHTFISRNAITGEIQIHDNCSKFGTLALIQRPMKLQLTTNKLQFGRNLVEIELKKKTKRCLCWDVDIKSKFDPKDIRLHAERQYSYPVEFFEPVIKPLKYKSKEDDARERLSMLLQSYE